MSVQQTTRYRQIGPGRIAGGDSLTEHRRPGGCGDNSENPRQKENSSSDVGPEDVREPFEFWPEVGPGQGLPAFSSCCRKSACRCAAAAAARFAAGDAVAASVTRDPDFWISVRF